MPYKFHLWGLSLSFELRSLIRCHSFRCFSSIQRIRVCINPMCSTHSVVSLAVDKHIKISSTILVLALPILSLWEILWLSITSIRIVQGVLKIFEEEFRFANLFPLGMFDLILFWTWSCWRSIVMLTTVILYLSSSAIWETRNSVLWFLIMITFGLKTRTLVPRGCEDTLFDGTRLESYLVVWNPVMYSLMNY